MMSDPQEVADDLRARQKGTYEHQISRLSTQTKYPLGVDSSYMGQTGYNERGDDESYWATVPSQQTGREILVADNDG